MKHFACYFLFLCLPFALKAQTNNSSQFPDYTTVKQNLCHQYALTEDAYYHLEKRKEGWFLVKEGFENEVYKELQRDMVWSSKTNKYLPLPYQNKDHSYKQCENKLKISDWQKLHYHLSPYFGYAGWGKDFIERFEKEENLSDSMLYMLARAYRERANNLISGNYYATGKAEWNLPEGNNALNAEQLKIYLSFCQKALQSYEKLAKINPHFQTIVGSAYMKSCNEYADTFWNLCMFQNEKEAAKIFDKPLYNEGYVSYAKNMLNSCEKNAILLTNGDNDSYPLLYAQAYLGIRRDVLVANIALLSTSRFLEMLKNGLMDAPPAPISWEKTEIRKASSYIVLEKSNLQAVPLSELTNQIKKGEKLISACKFYYLKQNGDSILFDFSSYSLPPYLSLAEVAVLEMLQTAHFQRPIYCANSLNMQSMEHFKPYLLAEGFAYKITDSLQVQPKLYSKFHINTNNINVASTYQKFTQDFEWKGVETMGNYDRLVGSYLNTTCLLALALTEKGEKQKALEILQKMYQRVHGGGVGVMAEDIIMVDIYYKMEEIEKANELAKKILADIKRGNVVKPQDPFDKYDIDLVKMLQYKTDEYKQTKAVFGKEMN
jgi:hypothetical protein